MNVVIALTKQYSMAVCHKVKKRVSNLTHIIVRNFFKEAVTIYGRQIREGYYIFLVIYWKWSPCYVEKA